LIQLEWCNYVNIRAYTAKQILEIVITSIALVMLFYELFYVNIVFGDIDVRGSVNIDAVLISAGSLLLLLGPWLWLGEVSVAVGKIIEARSGRKVG